MTSRTLTEDQARQRVAESVGGPDRVPSWVQRGEGFWFFTFPDGQAPPGSPSWVVLDDGQWSSVGPRERLGEVLDRLQNN